MTYETYLAQFPQPDMQPMTREQFAANTGNNLPALTAPRPAMNLPSGFRYHDPNPRNIQR